MKRGRPQAKDIPDATVLAIVRSVCDQRRVVDCSPWAFTWDVEANLPGAHSKVLLAKLRALVKRRLLEGCACGCRGDFRLTDAGSEALRLSGVTIRAVLKDPF